MVSLYRRLLRKYGRQGWWPGDSQYEIVAGALLTQNTSWRNAEKAIKNLKNENLLHPSRILETPDSRLRLLLRPSGYYRQKAERLKILTRKYLEIKKRKSLPTREELLSLKGIGKETADSILLYAFDLPVFVIDAYTRRFCSHYGLFKGRGYDDYRSFFESSLPRSVPLYKEYHALIVAWAKDQKPKKSAI